GDEVADRYIGFMAHGADNRGGARGDSAGHGFLVEAPEVFQRATAAGQDQRIETLAVGQLQGANNLRRGIAALYGGGDQRQLNMRRAAAEHRDDIADHRTARRADDADALWVGGQGALAFGGKQAFGGEFAFQRIEGQAQGAVTGGLDVVEDQL